MGKVVRRSKEMQDLIDDVKEIIKEATYGTYTPKDVDCERIIVEKVRHAELFKRRNQRNF